MVPLLQNQILRDSQPLVLAAFLVYASPVIKKRESGHVPEIFLPLLLVEAWGYIRPKHLHFLL